MPSTIILRPSFRSIIPLILYFVIALAVAFRLTIAWESGNFDSIPVIRKLSPHWLMLVPALFLLEILRRRYNDLWELQENQINHYSGRIWFNYAVPSLRYSDITHIRVDQSIWGRMLGFGNVLLGTAAQDGTEMVIKGVADPFKAAENLEHLRDNELAKFEAPVDHNRED